MVRYRPLIIAAALAVICTANAFSLAPIPLARQQLAARSAALFVGPKGNQAVSCTRVSPRSLGRVPGLRMQQQMEPLVGEDAGVFEFSEQKLKSWAQFAGVFTVVFSALFVLWLNPSTGFGDEFAAGALSLAGGDSTVAMVGMLTFFGICHSGLAGLRRRAEDAINAALGAEGVGERVWRVFFGVVSLPLAVRILPSPPPHYASGCAHHSGRARPAPTPCGSRGLLT